MKPRTISHLLLASAAIALTGTAHAASEKFETKITVEKSDDGSYERKDVTTKVDPAGNSVSLEKKVKVDVEPTGDYKRSTKITETSDPKGLANKHVVEITDTQKLEDGKLETTTTKTIDGKNVLGEKDKYKSDIKVVEDDSGNYDEKTRISKTDTSGKVTYEKKAVVDIAADGAIDKTTTTKETNDPKGLGNKKTVATENTENIANGIVTSGQKISVDGKVVDSQRKSAPQ